MTKIFSQTNVYVDASNIFHNMGKIDYRALMRYLREKYETSNNVLRVKVFTPIVFGNSSPKKYFLRLMRECGYEVITTEAFKYSVTNDYKDNTDLHLAVSMIEDLQDERVSRFVLMSGDKDFLFVVEKVIHANREVEIISPGRAACKEYKTMQGFIEMESIPGIRFEPFGFLPNKSYFSGVKF